MQTPNNTSLAILETRCYLGEKNITILEVGITGGHLIQTLCLFRFKEHGVFANVRHGNERNDSSSVKVGQFRLSWVHDASFSNLHHRPVGVDGDVRAVVVEN